MQGVETQCCIFQERDLTQFCTKLLILSISPNTAAGSRSMFCDDNQLTVAYPEFLNGSGRGPTGSGGERWRGYPLTTGGRVWGGAGAVPRKLFIFFVEITIF